MNDTISFFKDFFANTFAKYGGSVPNI